ncbi:MAG TPA: BlaI/MecI/CopY family transcriptional regulator [Candidatus Angelobacter sp.]|nr:BlaI/MecI/CopY family transcriptional regulator [Candidatus Angelobacter sp.]
MWLKRQSGVPPSLEQLGSLESRLMERIWARGEVNVSDLQAEFVPLAYTTIMTTLDRLFKKGLLDRRKIGKAYFYQAKLSEKEYHERLTQHLFGMVLNGGNDSNVVLSGFVNAVSVTDQQMLDKLEELVKAKRRELRRR